MQASSAAVEITETPIDAVIYDTSFRDGVQGDGNMPTPDNAIKITKRMIDAGVSFVEYGVAKDSPVLSAVLAAAREEGFLDKISLFGMSRRKEVAQILKHKALNATIVCKARKRDVKRSLGKEPSIFLKEVPEFIQMLKSAGMQVFIDLEHAVDAYFGYCVYGRKVNDDTIKENRLFLYALINACVKAGADTLVVCDTNGGADQTEIREIFESLKARFPGVSFGFHGHDDRCRALVNSQEAYFADINHIQGTFDGIGERKGNLNWMVFACDTQLNRDSQIMSEEKLLSLTELYVDFSYAFGRTPDIRCPYLGSAVTSTRAGIHKSGEEKDPGSYCFFNPELVGNRTRLDVDELTGKIGIRSKSRRFKVALSDDQALTFLDDRKNQTLLRAKVYILCPGSFRLACLRIAKNCDYLFRITDFRATSKKMGDEIVSSSKINLIVNGQSQVRTAKGRGTGIFDASYQALRKELKKNYPQIKALRLVDHEEKSLGVQEENSAAVTRVILTFESGGVKWKVGGVSPSLEVAGLNALVDGIHLHLIDWFGCP